MQPADGSDKYCGIYRAGDYGQYGAQLFGGRLGMIHVPREKDSLNQRISYSSIPKPGE